MKVFIKHELTEPQQQVNCEFWGRDFAFPFDCVESMELAGKFDGFHIAVVADDTISEGFPFMAEESFTKGFGQLGAYFYYRVKRCLYLALENFAGCPCLPPSSSRRPCAWRTCDG